MQNGDVSRTRLRLRWDLLIVVIASLLVCVSVERFGGPRYTLEPLYTDHLRHEYSAWAFLHIGFDVYRIPLEQWSVGAEHLHLEWGQVPMLYPPGVLLAFLPFGVASNTGLVSDERVHMLIVAVLGGAAAVAAFQFFRTLRLTHEATLGGVFAILGAVLFMTWDLGGFPNVVRGVHLYVDAVR